MQVIHHEQIEARPVTTEGAHGATIREVFTAETGAPTFAMRVFELAPGGCTPRHTHPWEHEVFVLAGSGCVEGPEGCAPLSPGTAVLVAPDEVHSFRSAADQGLKFICLIPVEQTCCR
ncbi:MAG: cupin domain-containing protein [Armatimonadetes bacterium]|nr:cupin domain-containing protein [Armatimonadota bacterium]